MAGIMAFFMFVVGLISICIYIYLVILAGRFVAAVDRISAAAERVSDRYVRGPGGAGPVL